MRAHLSTIVFYKGPIALTAVGGKDLVTAVEVAAAQTDCSGHLYRCSSSFPDESIRETESVDIESRSVHGSEAAERQA